MLAFISYARADEAVVMRLRDSLVKARCQVWLDQQATGGQRWWSAILEQIRNRDVIVHVLSPAGLDSRACELERQYAQALGKPPSTCATP